jgi:hypothetical protein
VPDAERPRSHPFCKAAIVFRAASGDSVAGAASSALLAGEGVLLPRSCGARLAWRIRVGRPGLAGSVVLILGSAAGVP